MPKSIKTKTVTVIATPEKSPIITDNLRVVISRNVFNNSIDETKRPRSEELNLG